MIKRTVIPLKFYLHFHNIKNLMSAEMCGAFQSRIFLFSCACLSGILFALVWRKYEQTVQLSSVRNHYGPFFRKSNYNEWLKQQNISGVQISEENLRYGGDSKKELESLFLYRTVPVLCLVFVNSHNGADAVKQTWAKHCNIVVFFGRFVDEKIPVLSVPRVNSFEGFCYAFTHVLKKYSNQFDWMLITDDSTYSIIENLRHYVAPLNSSFPYYLGHPVKGFSNLYNVGTAGIVMSKGSLSLINAIYSSASDCKSKNPPSWYFDQSIGRILYNYNVHPGDTRDGYLRARFNPFSVETMLVPGSISVFSSYWRSSAFISEEGMNCCSDRAITFHGMQPSKLYLMEYLQNHLTVFKSSSLGIGNKPPLNQKKSDQNIFLSDEMKQVGKPFIQLVKHSWIKSYRRKVKIEKANKKLWNDIFDDS